jgi:hypothetical protein
LDFGWKVGFLTLFEGFGKVGKVNIARTGSKVTIKTRKEVEDNSILSSVPLEQNSIGQFDKLTIICRIKHLPAQRQIVLYEKQ